MNSELYITRNFGSSQDPGGQKLNLNLYADNESFTFAVIDQDFKQVLSLQHVHINQSMAHGQQLSDHLRFLISNYRLDQQQFGQVNIAVLQNSFALMPGAFALKEASKEILGFTTGESPLYTHAHQVNNLVFQYTLTPELLQQIERSFHKATIRHAGAVAIHLLFNNRSLRHCDVLLNLSEGIFEIAARKEQQLIYYNLFEHESAEDVLYYLLFMMEQFGLDPLRAKVGVAGHIEAESDIFKALKKFLPNLSFAVNQLRPPAGASFPEHFYFTLLNQHLCEL